MARPEHHDFWRLVTVVNEGDDQADLGVPIPEIMTDLVDMESLIYMADQRVMRIERSSRAMRNLTAEGRAAVVALYIDAFRTGVRFQQEGGHSDG